MASIPVLEVSVSSTTINSLDNSPVDQEEGKIVENGMDSGGSVASVNVSCPSSLQEDSIIISVVPSTTDFTKNANNSTFVLTSSESPTVNNEEAEPEVLQTTTTTKRLRTQRQELTLEQKMRVIQHSDEGMSQRKLADMFNVSKTQIYRVIRRKEKVKKFIAANGINTTKRLSKHRTRQPAVNRKAKEWYELAKMSSTVVSGPQLQAVAKRIAEKLEVPNFKASNGWLDSFRRRHQIQFKAPKESSANKPLPGPSTLVVNTTGWQAEFFSRITPDQSSVVDSDEESSSGNSSSDDNHEEDRDDTSQENEVVVENQQQLQLHNVSVTQVTSPEAYEALQKLKVFSIQNGLLELHEALLKHELQIVHKIIQK